MTQEKKQPLLSVLCSMLPYGIKCYYNSPEIDDDVPEGISIIKGFKNDGILVEIESGDIIDIDYIKPYLRSISSMTEEEEKELNNILPCSMSFSITVNEELMLNTDNEYDSDHYFSCFVDVQDWLNAHHFDYRELIKKGLALKAPEDMYIK